MDCKRLKREFSATILLPDSDDYNSSISSYFASFEIEVSPDCIFAPSTALEVSDFLKTIQGRHQGLGSKIAVRGGGHTPWSGAANIERGITIDLRKIDGVVVDPVKRVASIGGGANWSDVYRTLETQGLAVSGGRVSNVGVGGLTTGGGLSLFSGQSGFVCDNVLNFEVVLASGEIVQASENVNEALFYALKGGSNNFGIVTRIDLPTFEQGPMWGGLLILNETAAPDVFRQFNTFATAPSAESDPKAHVIVAASWAAGTEYSIASIYHADPAPNPSSLQPFVEIEPKLHSTIREDSLLGFANEQSASNPSGQRHLFYTTSFRPDSSGKIMLEFRDLWREALEPIKTTPGLAFSLVFQPLTLGLLEASASKGGNSLGLEPTEPVIIILLDTQHANAVDDDTVTSAALKLIDRIETHAEAKGNSAQYRFMNYGYRGQKILEGYGLESLRRLQSVSQKYDPSQFFQNMVPGGFKLKDALIGAHE